MKARLRYVARKRANPEDTARHGLCNIGEYQRLRLVWTERRTAVTASLEAEVLRREAAGVGCIVGDNARWEVVNVSGLYE